MSNSLKSGGVNFAQQLILLSLGLLLSLAQAPADPMCSVQCFQDRSISTLVLITDYNSAVLHLLWIWSSCKCEVPAERPWRRSCLGDQRVAPFSRYDECLLTVRINLHSLLSFSNWAKPATAGTAGLVT
jgi:hypothetical protein